MGRVAPRSGHYVVRDPNVMAITHMDVDDDAVSNWIMGERTSAKAAGTSASALPTS